MSTLYHLTQQQPMNSEANRLQTFVNWSVPFIEPEVLALLGFYYFLCPDTVKCNFCNIELKSWERGDDVLLDHRKWSPSCKLISGQYTQNVPIDANKLQSMLSIVSHNDTYSSLERTTISEGCINDNIYPKFPKYAEFEQRIGSYLHWPQTNKQQPTALSDAGFFYTGTCDSVVCFWCGGELSDWQPTYNPFAEHANYFGHCKYTKHQNFVSKIPQPEQEKTTNNRECPVCYLTADHAISCGHIFCKPCLFKIENKKCPVCKTNFIATKALRLFFN